VNLSDVRPGTKLVIPQIQAKED
jgi:hypothetical protein